MERWESRKEIAGFPEQIIDWMENNQIPRLLLFTACLYRYSVIE